jgi:hypothetical protein
MMYCYIIHTAERIFGGIIFNEVPFSKDGKTFSDCVGNQKKAVSAESFSDKDDGLHDEGRLMAA